MAKLTDIILYVADPAKSAEHYAKLLGRAATSFGPAYSQLTLDGGVVLGLLQRDDVKPTATVAGGGCEHCLGAESNAAVDAICADWRAKGAKITLEPFQAPFGYSFVTEDADGHRLRVLHPSMPG